MQYSNCIEAISFMRNNIDKECNVNKERDKVRCAHKSTPCDWVGNDMQYACLYSEHKNSQKVYTHLNSGYHGQIIKDDN